MGLLFNSGRSFYINTTSADAFHTVPLLPEGTAFWFKMPSTNPTSEQCIFEFDRNGVDSSLEKLTLTTAGKLRYQSSDAGGLNTSDLTAADALTSGWRWLFVHAATGSRFTHIDNAAAAAITTPAAARLDVKATRASLGRSLAGGSTDYLDGEISSLLIADSSFNGTERTDLFALGPTAKAADVIAAVNVELSVCDFSNSLASDFGTVVWTPSVTAQFGGANRGLASDAAFDIAQDVAMDVTSDPTLLF